MCNKLFQVSQSLFQTSYIPRGHYWISVQNALSAFRFVGQQVVFVSFVTCYFTSSGNFEAAFQAAVCFHLRHGVSSLNIMRRQIADKQVTPDLLSFRSQNHNHAAAFQLWLALNNRYISHFVLHSFEDFWPIFACVISRPRKRTEHFTLSPSPKNLITLRNLV